MQGYDRYAYVNNSPILYTDPSGHANECSETVGGSCVFNKTSPGLNEGGGSDGGGENDNGNVDKKFSVGNDGCKQLGLSNTACGNVVNGFTNITILLDHIAFFLSFGEAVAADFLLFGATTTTIAQPELASMIGEAFLADQMIANGLGLVENPLGGLSFLTTGAADYLTGNTTWTNDGLYLGKDTIVAARNAVLGLYPESNIDFVVSASQLKYDMQRLKGEKSGGSINIADPNSLFDQIVWYDSPLQDIFNGVVGWKSKMSRPYGR